MSEIEKSRTQQVIRGVNRRQNVITLQDRTRREEVSTHRHRKTHRYIVMSLSFITKLVLALSLKCLNLKIQF